MNASDTQKNPVASIAIIGGLFFIMGWFTWINGPLIAFVQLAFDLPLRGIFLISLMLTLTFIEPT